MPATWAQKALKQRTVVTEDNTPNAPQTSSTILCVTPGSFRHFTLSPCQTRIILHLYAAALTSRTAYSRYS